MKLYVIIVTFKGKQWYERCFSSLRESTIPVQAIVVDNASNDGTMEYIKEQYPEIHLIESKENLGFGRANNLAMRYALNNGCDYVFLLNQDAWVAKDTLEKLVNVHRKHSDYGILSPVHLNVEEDHFEKGLLNYLDDKNITDKTMFEDMYFGRMKEIYETRYVNAAAWLLPRKTLETIGGFDPIFSHYGEDDNYLQRALFHQIKIGICPQCSVVHDTERRIVAADKKIQTGNSKFLAEIANINTPLKVDGLCLYHFRKAVSKLLMFKTPQAKKHWEDMRFICRNAKAIKNSRKTNVVPGTNWLT